MQETQEMQIWSLGWEYPLEKGMVTHLVFLPGESHGQRNLAGTVHGVGHNWSNLAHTHEGRLSPWGSYKQQVGAEGSGGEVSEEGASCEEPKH